MPSTGRTLLSLVALTTMVGGYIADWNETHVYNPRWPPHAKFHNGQTMSMGAVLGLTTFYFLYGWPAQSSQSAATQRLSLHTASWVASLYWITQLSALFYPGSLAVDPEFGEGAPQVYICAVLLSLIGVGLWLERSRIATAEKKVA
ncbi:uncharacterized protein BHQ10_008255 [Talaromyces amestolkiae]|uniref:Acetyltransferase n=1 Tax=Talaromyces amestolkiae TaxID=1196081 RepID=A0A364L8Z3_TALAM|nr:uncharacterized protein BHQ10_008255 [Talaromyces amestolkiae]RAO72243.1 hypothetical protein BHQ10_008255 [Talaromyces amestolkiae]